MHNAQVGRVLYARSDLSSFVSAAILSFLIFGGLFFAILNWPERPADPTVSFAAAFDSLSEVGSIHFTVEEERDGGVGSYKFTNLGVLDLGSSERHFPADWDAFKQQTEEECIVQEGPYRYCIVRKRGTGEEVGQVEWGYGLRTTREGAFARPSSVHYTETLQPDRDLRIAGPRVSIESELLYLDGVAWSRNVNGDRYWRIVSEDGLRSPPESDLYAWGLLETSVKERPNILDRYDRVEGVEDAELDGVPVRRYLAEGKEGSELLEIWVGKEDGLVRKAVKSMRFGEGEEGFSEEFTYTFSRFNEPVEIPRPWPCFGGPYC